MKYITTSIATIIFLIISSFSVCAKEPANTVNKVKEGTKKAVTDIKDGASQTGKAAVKFGKDVKKGTQKTWSDVKQDSKQTGKSVKEGLVEVGRKFKKAYQETKTSIKKEISQDNSADGD